MFHGVLIILHAQKTISPPTIEDTKRLMRRLIKKQNAVESVARNKKHLLRQKNKLKVSVMNRLLIILTVNNIVADQRIDSDFVNH